MIGTFKLYSAIVSERLEAAPHTRYAMCASKLEMLLLDQWCLVRLPHRSGLIESRIQSLLRVCNEELAGLRMSSAASQRFMRQLVDYRSASSALLHAAKSARNLRVSGERLVSRFDGEFEGALSRLTDALLYGLAGVTASNPEDEWVASHGLMTVAACQQEGQQRVQQLIQRMRGETYQLEVAERRAAQREQLMRQQFGMPGLGRYVR